MTAPGQAETGVWEGVNVKNLLLALVIALNVSCGSAAPDQATASARPGQATGSARPGQEIDFDRARLEMVEEQIEARGITDSRVLAAMSRVPRHEYVPVQYLSLIHISEPTRPY